MDLDQQLAIIKQDAITYGLPSEVVEKALIPAIKTLALPLQHTSYYLAQSSNGSLVLETLASREDAQLQKKVIYAFAREQDALLLTGEIPGVMTKSVPIGELLLKLLILNEVDSLVVFDTPTDLNQGKEISRHRLSSLIRAYLTQDSIPPNLA